MISLLTLIALVIPLLLVQGFFAGSELALLSADKISLRKQARARKGGAQSALDLANHPEKVLSTTLLITNLCMITLSSLISLFFLGYSHHYAEVLAVAVASPLVVIVGELVPKTIFQRFADRIAPWVARPVKWTYLIFFPITRLLSGYTTRLSRLVGPIEILVAGKKRTTRDDLRTMLNYSRKETEIKASEKRMIRRIFEFRESEARHALIPLVKVEAIEEHATIGQALERFEKHRHSRMPVFQDRIVNIVGILEIGDLLSAQDLSQPIRHYISPPTYVAEKQPLEDLLKQMRSEDTEIVVVVDEHGGAVGILTFEDIVEEIVGEISDEDDHEAPLYKELEEGRWQIQAKMEIEAINEALRLELPHGEYETLSGFLLQQFGRIPESRDELFFDTPAGTLKFTIRKATERHIEVVLVERLNANDTASED